MVKYLAMVAAVVLSLAIAGEAQARGRHGCKSCGGCPGGNCSVQYAPAKQASTDNAPPGLTAATPAPAPAAAATMAPTTTSYAYTSARRGLFGRR